MHPRCTLASAPRVSGEFAYRVVGRTVLEAHDEAHLECHGESLWRLDGSAVLAAFDTGDRRVTGAHPCGELFLGEVDAAADDYARQLNALFSPGRQRRERVVDVLGERVPVLLA